MRDFSTVSPQAIHREALRWFLRLRAPDCSPQEKDTFERWLAGHPAHCKEYESIQRLWDRMNILETNPMPEFEKIFRDRSPQASIWASANLFQFAVVAAMMLLVFGGVWWWNAMRVTVHPYQTATGERQTVTLPDGTVMELNTNTSLSVHLSSQERRVVLDKGEVYLTVAHESERPFIVLAEGGKILDIGTQFSVYTQEDTVLVTVAEGEVQVELDPESPRTTEGHIRHLTAGECLAYTHSGIWSEVEPIQPHLIAAWRRGKLIFEGIPLSEALQEVKRYWPGQIILADESLAGTKVKGIFDLKNLSGIFQALPQILPVQVTQDRAGRMILSRATHN